MTVTVLADERELLVAGVRDLARHELLPAADALDRGDAARRDACWAQVCALGLDRALLGEDAGGSDLPAGTWLAMVEELAAAEPGVALATALHALALYALPASRAAAVAAGERWTVVPHAGQVSPAAAGAAGVVLLGDAAGGAACVLEPGVGWSVAADAHQMGLRAAPAGVLVRAGAPAVAAQRTSGELRALVLAATAAVATGIARRAYDLAVEYAAFRRQGGHAIGRYGAVRQMLGGMAERLHARPCPAFDDGDGGAGAGDGALARALAQKIIAAEAAAATTIDAVQVLGGSGYMRESGVEKLMRDAKYCQLYPEPTWRCRAELIALEARLPPALCPATGATGARTRAAAPMP